jgi:hypothetical protein
MEYQEYQVNAVAPGGKDLTGTLSPKFITIEKLVQFLATRNVFVYHLSPLTNTLMVNSDDRPDWDEKGKLL